MITQPEKCLGTAAKVNKFGLYSVALVQATLSVIHMPDNSYYAINYENCVIFLSHFKLILLSFRERK